MPVHQREFTKRIPRFAFRDLPSELGMIPRLQKLIRRCIRGCCGLRKPSRRQRFRADVTMQQPRLHNIKVLPDVSLTDDHRILPDKLLLHCTQHACLLLLVEITEDEVVGDGRFDTPKLVIRLWVDRQWFIGATIDNDRLCAHGSATCEYGRGRRVEAVSWVQRRRTGKLEPREWVRCRERRRRGWVPP